MADWSRAEVEAIVADYLGMLELELRGERYNKSEHRRLLRRRLDERSDGSVERKHQNISAILIALGVPYVVGYKPLRNYQQLLFDVVVDRLETARPILEALRREVDRPADSIGFDDLPTQFEAPPEPGPIEGDRVSDSIDSGRGPRVPRFVDYLAREGRNISLGSAGEDFVVHFETARLRAAGRGRLADRIEHVSATRGDGLGFDVLSYEPDGRERLIEVKTTAFGKYTPFFLTRNELQCSRERESDYHLYRVFSFRKTPRVFALDGRLDVVCRLDPVQWIARAS